MLSNIKTTPFRKKLLSNEIRADSRKFFPPKHVKAPGLRHASGEENIRELALGVYQISQKHATMYTPFSYPVQSRVQKQELTKNMPTIFVTLLSKSIVTRLHEDLQEQGFAITKPAHTLFSAKKPGISVTLYESLKLTVQGKNMGEFIEFYLEPQILKSTAFTYKNELLLQNLDKRARIGVDEAGKGDYFGPLCVAGVFADESSFQTLIELGVKDSKKLSDTQVRKIAPEIVKKVPNYIVRLKPKKYNELYSSFRNLNSLLAWCHATVIENLAAHYPVDVAIIDQFASEHVVEQAIRKKRLTVKLEQRVRGEEDLVVAAASIVARWGFIEGIAACEKEFNVTLPKGASSAVVKQARAIVKEYGSGILENVAKLHFKTTKEVV
jgi:ribonuclease HIII